MWKWAKRSEAAPSITNMVRLTRGMPGVVTGHRDLDAHPWLLNVINGTINLKNGALLAHDPEHLLTKQAPVIYDPNATAPLWEECLQRWQPDPAVRSYLQRLIGSAATGHPVEEVSINIGGGNNGKGKFYGAVAGVLGTDYVVVPHKSLLVAQRHEQHDTVKADLFGARMALAAETEAGDRLDEAKVKELTGGDQLAARRMHEDPWQFMPSHTLILHTNYRPRIRGGDEGIWRRVRLVPWNVTIPAKERDKFLAAKLAKEASGILNWIIAGCTAWQTEGLNPPASVTEATAAYRHEEDHLGRFLADTCTIGAGLAVTAKALRDAYEKWCADTGETPWTAKAVGAQLDAKGYDSIQVGHAKTRTWKGLGLPPKQGPRQ
jgi:putative DNA primase/helicase